MKTAVPMLLKLAGAATLVALIVLAASHAKQIGHANVVDAAPVSSPAPAAVAAPAVTPSTDAPEQGETIRLVRNAKPVPDFSVKTFDGRVVTPATLNGKVAIINFWATWCGPCRAEIPAFVALQQKYGDSLVILGLSEDETGEAAVRQFVAANHMTYPVGMASEALDAAFGGTRGVPSLPMSFVIDRTGKVVQRHVGLYSSATYENEVRALLDMPVSLPIERFDDDGHVSQQNASEAKEIPGIDLTVLTPEQRKTVLLRLNTELCTCGCKSTVAQCRIDDPTCTTSLPLAKKILAEIVKGGK
jgi:thiol-disulfide isomerase/thioredoxin